MKSISIRLFLIVLFSAMLAPHVVLAQNVERIVVTVQDAQSRLVRNAEVELLDGSSFLVGFGYTDSQGQVIFAGPFIDGPYEVIYEKNGTQDDHLFSVSFSGSTNINGVDTFNETATFGTNPTFSQDQFFIDVLARGSPVPNAYVDILDSSESFVTSCLTDSVGRCDVSYFPNGLPAGQYLLRVSVSSLSPPLFGPFLDTTLSVTLSGTNSSYVEGGYRRNITLNIQEATRYIEVRLYESSATNPALPDTSRPVAGASVYSFSYNNTNEFYSGTTNSSGVAQLPLGVNASGTYSVSASGNDFNSIFREISVPNNSSNPSVTLVVRRPNASIRLRFFDSNNNPVLATTNEFSVSDIWAHCFPTFFDPNDPAAAPQAAFKDVPGETNSVILPVEGGYEYRCSASAGETRAVEAKTVTVAANSQSTLNLRVLNANRVLRVRFLDAETGELISGTPLHVSVHLDTLGSTLGGAVDFGAFATTTNGAVQMNVVGGYSYSGFAFPALTTGSGAGSAHLLTELGNYVTPIEFSTTVGSSNQTINISVQKYNAEAKVCLSDDNGVPVTSGFAFAHSPAGAGSTVPDFFSSKDLSPTEGCAELGLIAGRDYFVEAVPFNAGNGAIGGLLPAPKIVRLKAGERLSLNFESLVPNFTLNVTPDPSSAVGAISFDDTNVFGHCIAERADGVASFSGPPTGNSIPLQLSIKNKSLPTAQQQAFTVHCAVFRGDPDGGIGTQFFETFTFRPEKGTNEATLLTPFNNETPFYPEQMFNVESSVETKIPLPSGGYVTIPSQGIAEDGEHSFSITSPTEVPRVEGKGLELLDQIDLTPRRNGEGVSTTAKSIEICFDYTEEELRELGVSKDALVIGHIDPILKSVTLNPVTFKETVLEDEDGDRLKHLQVCTTSTTFSIFTKLIETARELRDTVPSSLRIAKPKKAKSSQGTKKSKAVNRWRVAFNFEDADESVRFLFRYSFASKKKCMKTDPEELPLSVVVQGTEGFFIEGSEKKKNLCGALSVAGNGAFSSTKHQSAKKRKK